MCGIGGMVDTPVLGIGGEIRGSSSLLSRTKNAEVDYGKLEYSPASKVVIFVGSTPTLGTNPSLVKW